MSTKSLMNRAARHARAERRWQERFARRHGFFWIPCPLCKVPFSGAEWRDIDGKPSTLPDPTKSGRGTGICPSCTQAGLGVEHG